MQLKSFGCSFVYGSDLRDTSTHATPSQLSWPALLAQQLGHEYVCHARPGVGNLYILEQLLNELTSNDPAVYVVNWTWIDRFDYTDHDNSWSSLRPGEDNSTAKLYYKNLHSQYRDKLTTLSSIKLAIDTLLQKKQSFIMTYMDDLIFETQWHTSPAIASMQDYVQPYLRDFDGLNFLAWAQHNNFEISPTLHPLESAHSAAANLILNQSLV
jgi:hypothetical protein